MAPDASDLKAFTMTPYAATGLVNRELAKAGIRHPRTGEIKTVAPTMLYGYARQGKFRRRRSGDGRWAIDQVSFHKWLQGYVERLAERQAHREELDETPQTTAA
jgi:hypothetical protein